MRPGERPGEVTICIWHDRPIVCRWLDPKTFTSAANWEELEPAAKAAVYKQGGALTRTTGIHYECPPELAARARWRKSNNKKSPAD